MIKKSEKYISSIILFILIVYFALPHLWLVLTAFNPAPKPFLTIFTPALNNFIRVFKEARGLIYFKNSVLMGLFTMIIATLTSAAAGFGFAKLKIKGKNTILLILLITTSIPLIGYIVPYYKLTTALRMTNSYWGCILLFSSSSLPFNIWLVKQFVETLPKELIEAAQIDGCNMFDVFIKIILPVSLPVLIIVSLNSFNAAWGNFLAPQVLLTKSKLFPLSVGMVIESITPYGFYDLGLFSAFSIIYALPVAILYIFLRKYLLKGMLGGAVKG